MTALSDIEVIHKDVEGAFYHITYPLADGSGALEVATTRPETFFGDTAVAVNPADERYAKYIGQSVILLSLTKKFLLLVTNTQIWKKGQVWLKLPLPMILTTSWLVNVITCHKLM